MDLGIKVHSFGHLYVSFSNDFVRQVGEIWFQLLLGGSPDFYTVKFSEWAVELKCLLRAITFAIRQLFIGRYKKVRKEMALRSGQH